MRLNLLCIFFFFPLFVFSQSGWNMNLLGSFDYETNHNTKCNDIWGWEDGNGNEDEHEAEDRKNKYGTIVSDIWQRGKQICQRRK